MWGKYVESEIRDAAKEAKDERSAEASVSRIVRQIMHDPEDDESEVPTKGRFRDPASMLKKG